MKMKAFLIPAKFLQIIVLSGWTQWASATMQLPELLEYDGTISEFGGFGDGMVSLPLDDYFRLNPDKRPAWRSSSTNLWRGYVGTWRIADQRLWLVSIQTGRGFELVPYPLGQVFKLTGPCVSAEWYSGKIPYRKTVVKTGIRKTDGTPNGQREVKFHKIESLVIEKGIVVKTVTEFDNP